jgi:hypothetical protein
MVEQTELSANVQICLRGRQNKIRGPSDYTAGRVNMYSSRYPCAVHTRRDTTGTNTLTGVPVAKRTAGGIRRDHALGVC